MQNVHFREPGRCVRRQALLDGLRDLLRRACGAGALLMPDPIELLEDGREAKARSTLSVARGKVGPCEERLPVGSEEDAHRPAAVLRQHLHGLHVDGVDVGPLLPVDLHRDETLVEDPGDVGRLERFLLHHVAPVTGGVTDAEEHWPIEAARFGERLVAPWAPVDGIVRVLQEVGRGFQREAVRPLRRAIRPKVAGSELAALRDGARKTRAKLVGIRLRPRSRLDGHERVLSLAEEGGNPPRGGDVQKASAPALQIRGHGFQD